MTSVCKLFNPVCNFNLESVSTSFMLKHVIAGGETMTVIVMLEKNPYKFTSRYDIVGREKTVDEALE